MEPTGFTGEYRHTIDAKGRLIVPSRLRADFPGDVVVLSVWPDGCISMWSEEGWVELRKQLLEQQSSDEELRSVVRAIAASAHTDQIDRQGRIGVPPKLRDFADITRDVVVVGNFNHGEIWNPDRWAPQEQTIQPDRLKELFNKMNL